MPDGTLQLVDGHLRAETTPDQEVPVLVLDLDDAEADKLLAVFDPISAMASSDRELLDELVHSIETQNESLRHLLDDMVSTTENGKEVRLPALFQILVECQDEEQQQALYQELVERGVKIKILNL
jgi:DNA polymerase IIIc chi subunit